MTIPPNTKPTEPSSLFSLSSLESLAVATDLLTKSGPAAQEGSGVLDIQALAHATQHRRLPADSVAPTVPALLTPNLPRGYDAAKGLSKGTKLAMAGMGASIVSLGVAVAYLALREPTLPSAEPLAAAAAVQAPLAPVEAAVSPSAPAPSAAEASANTPATPEAPALESDGAKPNARSMRPHAARSDVARASESDAKKPVASAPAQSNASIDSLLDKALGGAPAAKPRASAQAPSAATPSRDEVLTEMKKVGARVKSCGGEPGSMALAKVSVAGSTGRVTNVDIEGPVDTKVRACITREVSRVKLAPFSAPTFSVTYPFRL
jgi:hypothetical protein